MDTNRKVEFSVLLPQSESKKISYAGIDDAYHHCGHDENGNNNKSNSNNRQQHRKDIQPWKTVAIVSIILLVGLILAVGIDPGGVVSSSSNPMQWKLRKNSPRCQFCDQSPPTLHHNKSYTIKNVSGIDNGNGNGKDKDVIGVIGETTIVEILVSWDARKANASSPAELERGRPGLPEAPILIPLLLDALALALTLSALVLVLLSTIVYFWESTPLPVQ
mmetsp:Transcript_12057/g.24504  ORF Transcript_12057/g.24504 Transcript_12057/m.24504 type:complete len:219 (+) Transcript_12057:27-683(+)